MYTNIEKEISEAADAIGFATYSRALYELLVAGIIDERTYSEKISNLMRQSSH